MIFLEFFLFFSIFSFLILLLILTYFSFLQKNVFSYSLSRIIQGEVFKERDFETLSAFGKNNFSGKKLWLSYRLWEYKRDLRHLEKAYKDLENRENIIKSAAINYFGALKEEKTFEKILPFLKSENFLLRIHAINSLKEISLKNFNLFKKEFEKNPNLLLEVSLEILYGLEKENKRDLFFLLKKYFYNREEIMERWVPFLENFFDKNLYEEILYQLDIFPLSFQEGFINIFLKNMEVQNYISFFDLKFKTSPPKLRYIYIYGFAYYYSEKDFKQALEFLDLLQDNEKEIFLKKYFPQPEEFMDFLINLNSPVPENCFNIIIEKITLLKHPKTLKVMENLLSISKNKDPLIFKFFNLILDWKEEEIKKMLLWILTKIENPVYREKIYGFLKEKNFDI